MQLHITEYERNFSVLWLFLATVPVTWTVCQSGPCTHIMNNGRIYCIFCVICQTDWTYSTQSASGFLQIARKLIVPKLHPLLLSHCQCVCLSFRYQPFLLYTVLPFQFPQHALQTYSTMYINYINRPNNFLESASEISDMNFQWNSSNGIRDTAVNVHCSSATVHLTIDPSIPKIQRL